MENTNKTHNNSADLTTTKDAKPSGFKLAYEEGRAAALKEMANHVNMKDYQAKTRNEFPKFNNTILFEYYEVDEDGDRTARNLIIGKYERGVLWADEGFRVDWEQVIWWSNLYIPPQKI